MQRSHRQATPLLCCQRKKWKWQGHKVCTQPLKLAYKIKSFYLLKIFDTPTNTNNPTNTLQTLQKIQQTSSTDTPQLPLVFPFFSLQRWLYPWLPHSVQIELEDWSKWKPRKETFKNVYHTREDCKQHCNSHFKWRMTMYLTCSYYIAHRSLNVWASEVSTEEKTLKYVLYPRTLEPILQLALWKIILTWKDPSDTILRKARIMRPLAFQSLESIVVHWSCT